MTSYPVHKLARASVQRTDPYPNVRRNLVQGADKVFLNENTNPLSPYEFSSYPIPHPSGLALKYIEFLSSQDKAKQKDSTFENKRFCGNAHRGSISAIREQNVLFTNGSEEGLDLIFRAFCEPSQDRIAISVPTFELYHHLARIYDVSVELIPMVDVHCGQVDVERLASSSTKVLFLCSPNNPTGGTLNAEHLIQILEFYQGIVVVDEAYIEFSTTASFAVWVSQYPNLIIVRTFSKAWGLAGIRAGVVIADPSIIEALVRVRTVYSFSAPAAALVDKALEQKDLMLETVTAITTERERVRGHLLSSPKVTSVNESQANFLCVFLKTESTWDELEKQGIFVTPCFSKIPGAIRVSIGTAEQNSIFLRFLKCIGTA